MGKGGFAKFELRTPVEVPKNSLGVEAELRGLFGVVGLERWACAEPLGVVALGAPATPCGRNELMT